jgi:hypothetical protein
MTKRPGINVDILVSRNHQLLLGLMTGQWNYDGRPPSVRRTRPRLIQSYLQHRVNVME